ncbi:coiled-coil domain-containing protein 14 isoform X2 [Tachyglossus aculeatus]|uniref:coiled-coil domain-containing protein 14 isoform X2 n=1 Tax=Tachyglossus aculeatus TaxID=9261 RepID=UPI0018F3D6D0|nr:coiled-coil domain-containing protein 14 isoform X2 [Tachyglossus aculeatus]
MARSGPRGAQVLSSGRLAGPVRLTRGQKGPRPRKASRLEPGSADRVGLTQGGLGRCASLLQDMMRVEDASSVCAGAGRVGSGGPWPRPPVAAAATGGRGRSASRKGPKKSVLATGLCQELPTAPAGTRRMTPGDQAGTASGPGPCLPVCVPPASRSPEMGPALCEHVQTQMAWVNAQGPPSKAGGTVETWVPSSSEAGPTSMYSPSGPGFVTAKAHPPTLAPVLDLGRPPGAQTGCCRPEASPTPGPTEPEGPGCRCPLEPRGGPGPPPLAPPPVTTPRPTRESALLRCLEAHLALWRQTPCGPTPGLEDKEAARDPVDIAPVREAACCEAVGDGGSGQGAQRLHTAKYLLGEIQALLPHKGGPELQRLVTEMAACLASLLAAADAAPAQPDIAPALPALRLDNTQHQKPQDISNRQPGEKAWSGLDWTCPLHSCEQLDAALAQVRRSQLQLDAAEKENRILGVTLRQRDCEVTRQRELTRTVQSSMAKLLSELSMDSRCPEAKAEPRLTRALLEVHTQQSPPDPSPACASVMSFLRQLDAAGPASSRAGWHSEVAGDLGDPAHGLDETMYLSLPREGPGSGGGARPVPPDSAGLDNSRGTASSRKPDAPWTGPDATPASEWVRAATGADAQLLLSMKEAIAHVPSPGERPPGPKGAGPPRAPGLCERAPASAPGGPDPNFPTGRSEWSVSSFSTFMSLDEQDFRAGLAALDANIARLQLALRTGLARR